MQRHTGRQARRLGVTCYRVYDHDLPEFPFCVEWYGDKLYVAEYRRRHGMTEEAHEQWLEQSIDTLCTALQVQKDQVYLKLRQRKPGRLGQYQRLDASKNETVVQENGLSFLVNLSDYLDTGLFLDHRLTRQMVREQAAGKKVLNLFAYTGSFSVYAAAGGAAKVVTADLSNTYLAWAKRNLEMNGFTDDTKFPLVQADVKAWLKQQPAASFDLIIMDPPTFSNSKRMDDILDIQRDHAVLINDSLALLQPGGRLFFSTNFRKFSLEKEKIKAAVIKDITKQTTPFDFEGRLWRWCFMMEV